LLQTAYLLPLTVVTLLLAVGALAFRAARRRGHCPFAVGLMAAVLVVVGKFALTSDWMTYGGIGLLVAASIWNSWPKRTTGANLIELGIQKNDFVRSENREEV
jgi:hypothetical protein